MNQTQIIKAKTVVIETSKNGLLIYVNPSSYSRGNDYIIEDVEIKLSNDRSSCEISGKHKKFALYMSSFANSTLRELQEYLIIPESRIKTERMFWVGPKITFAEDGWYERKEKKNINIISNNFTILSKNKIEESL